MIIDFETNKTFKKGDRVEFIDKEVAGLLGTFPEVGTCGTILGKSMFGGENDYDVMWDSGVEFSPFGWSCSAFRMRKCSSKENADK